MKNSQQPWRRTHAKFSAPINFNHRWEMALPIQIWALRQCTSINPTIQSIDQRLRKCFRGVFGSSSIRHEVGGVNGLKSHPDGEKPGWTVTGNEFKTSRPLQVQIEGIHAKSPFLHGYWDVQDSWWRKLKDFSASLDKSRNFGNSIRSNSMNKESIIIIIQVNYLGMLSK